MPVAWSLRQVPCFPVWVTGRSQAWRDRWGRNQPSRSGAWELGGMSGRWKELKDCWSPRHTIILEKVRTELFVLGYWPLGLIATPLVWQCCWENHFIWDWLRRRSEAIPMCLPHPTCKLDSQKSQACIQQEQEHRNKPLLRQALCVPAPEMRGWNIVLKDSDGGPCLR